MYCDEDGCDWDVPGVQHYADPPSTLSTRAGSIPRAGVGERLRFYRSWLGPEPRPPPKTTLKGRGAPRFAKAAPPSRLDRLIARARDMPAPHDYTLPAAALSNATSATFGKGNGTSYFEEVLRNAPTPAPGDYQTGARRLIGLIGGRFSTAPRPIFRRTFGDTGPAPHAYGRPKLPSGAAVRAVRFGHAPSNETLEAQAKRHAALHATPAPNAYDIKRQRRTAGAGKISASVLPSESDLMIRRNVPGPGTYATSSSLSGVGVPVFATASEPSQLDRLCAQAKDTPGPGDYHSSRLVAHGRRGQSTKISTANPKSAVDWAIYRSRDTPAPGDYDVSGAAGRRTLAASFSTGNVPTYMDQAAVRARHLPAPGDYNTAAGKAATMRRVQSSAHVMKTRTERFPTARVDTSILDHPAWVVIPSIPPRPGDRAAPSFTMGARPSGNTSGEGMLGKGQDPGNTFGTPACGQQILSAKETQPAFSFGGGRADKDDCIFSPVGKPGPGAARYNVHESFAKSQLKKRFSGAETFKQAKLKSARIRLWKWRSARNL